MNGKKSAGIARFFGNKDFYKMVLLVAIPIMVQNGITNFVGMLDNIMIGRVGTEPMSGASIANQLVFVYNMCIFGGVAGAGIFTAQYFGKGDMEGIRQTFRYKMYLSILLTGIAAVLFYTKGDILIEKFLQGEGEAGSIEQTLKYGKDYLDICILGLPAFMIGQAYAGTLRECGETVLPMKAGMASVFLNLALNYILIYGKFGAPALGVEGAAIATVVSRYLETGIILAVVHRKKEKYYYMTGLYKSLKVDVMLTKKIIIKGTPLLFNEALWAFGMTILTQCYSVRGFYVIAGLNICNTLFNVFNIVFIALGDSIAILVGQLLGAGRMEEARDRDNKMIVFSVLCCTVMAVLMFLLAPLFPKIYNTTEETRSLAADFIRISALFMPQAAFLHASYFTLRSGGKTLITFLFDSVFVWCVSVPTAYVLSRFTTVSVQGILIAVNLCDLIKCFIGFHLVKKGVWLQNIVEKEE